MKNRITTFILLIAMVIFVIFQASKDSNPVVLKVVTPTFLEIDLNNNGITDDGESFCVADTYAFTANLRRTSEKLADETGLTFAQSLAVGYLTDEFARKTLEGKIVRIEESEEVDPECRHARIYLDDTNYSEILKQQGYSIKNGKPENPEKFKQLRENADRLKLVIFNHKSLKYHTLDCKYGKAASDAVVLLLKEISKEAKPCKFCHVDRRVNSKFSQLPTGEQIPPPPGIVNDGNLQLIMTDFTTNLIPDRNCSNAICKAFVKNINEAAETIDIAAYGWSAIPAVDKALAEAKNRGVNIRIVYDTNTTNTSYYTETKDFVSNYENVRSDYIQGQPKLTNMLMHNKFAIFDSKKVYTGSMNFSITGFSGFNHNNVLIINSSKIAELFEAEFNQMYEGRFHTLKTGTNNNKHLQIGNSILSIYFSPQDKGITEAVVPLIRNSKKYIYLPTFLITHNALKEELLAAHKRGVDVRVIIDATNTSVRHSAFKELRAGGIPVKVENYAGKMHAKTIIIDDEYLILGSTNFSSSGENKNDENMIIIENPKLAKAYKNYFEYFWTKIPDKYLKVTISAESKASIGSCYDGVDNNFNGKIDKADAGCK